MADTVTRLFANPDWRLVAATNLPHGLLVEGADGRKYLSNAALVPTEMVVAEAWRRLTPAARNSLLILAKEIRGEVHTSTWTVLERRGLVDKNRWLTAAAHQVVKYRPAEPVPVAEPSTSEVEAS